MFRMRDMNALVFSPDGNSVVAARNVLREGSIFVLDVWSVRNRRESGQSCPLGSRRD